MEVDRSKMLRPERRVYSKNSQIYSVRNRFGQQSIPQILDIARSNYECPSLGEWILEFRWLGTAITLISKRLGTGNRIPRYGPE